MSSECRHGHLYGCNEYTNKTSSETYFVLLSDWTPELRHSTLLFRWSSLAAAGFHRTVFSQDRERRTSFGRSGENRTWRTCLQEPHVAARVCFEPTPQLSGPAWVHVSAIRTLSIVQRLYACLDQFASKLKASNVETLTCKKGAGPDVTRFGRRSTYWRRQQAPYTSPKWSADTVHIASLEGITRIK